MEQLMPWDSKANLRGPAGYNATGAAEDAQSLADFVNETAGVNPFATAIKAGLSPKANAADVVPKWKASTVYAAGDKVVSPSGTIVSAIAAFTSGATYAPQNWATPNTVAKPTAPAYLGGTARAKTWNPSLHLYNGESPTMRTIRSIVRKARAGERKRLVAAGDSKTAGSGSTQPQVAVSSFPAQLADLFGAKPGLIYANSWDTRWGSISGGVADAGGTSQNYMVAPAGSWSITFTSLEAFTGFKLFAYISAGGSISVTVDGVAQTAFTVASGSTWKSATYAGLADTVHTIVLAGTGLTSLLGLEPTYATGLTISNAGRPSSSAAEWLFPTDWSRLYSAAFSVNNSSLTASKPDAALINIGTNTNTSTLTDITTFITNVNALAIPVLLLSFGGVGSAGNYDSKRVRLYDIADSLDLPLLDFTSLIGDQPAATAAGLMQDTVHENTRGYALEADALARVLAY
jgi:lysophospholipase L1-like esterase